MRKLAIIALAAVAGAANAVVFSNGPTTDGLNSSNVPISITSLPQVNTGFSANSNALQFVADNFTVTGAGWNVTRISFFAYQNTASAAVFTFTSATASIRTGSDPNAGSSAFSVADAAVTNGGFVGYRVLSTQPNATQRPIYRVDLAVNNLSLAPGTHMLRWGLTGSLTSGPFVIPTAPFTSGNSFQSLGGGPYAPLIEEGSGLTPELAFEVEYTAVPEPATMIALGAGIAAVAARRRRK